MRYKVFSINKAAIFMAFIIIFGSCFSLFFLKESEKASNEIRKLPIYSVERNDKKIAITFDAAWGSEDTDTLIKILDKHHAKATFFLVGSWVRDNPQCVKKLYDAGHELSNHSDTHPAFSKISRGEIRKEILNCNKRIYEITGKMPQLVRAPSGDYNNKSIEVAESLKMKMIQWDVDSLDWKKLSQEDIFKRVIGKINSGSIILFHNGVENTPYALDRILTDLEERGYCFITVSELIYKNNYTIDNTGKQVPIS